MKLQTLTVIFIIIMLPITMVVSEYIETEISTISTQTQYDTILNNATYDAIKAFQLNQSNSSSSDVVTEKIRDVEASINTFYNSMASGMGVSGYTEEDLKDYIPCLVYTLYDGYYIYTKNSDGNYILKPYVYYTEQVGDYSVSYTLDSYIIVVGKDGTTKSGYLCSDKKEINDEHLEENVEYYDDNGNIQVKKLQYIYNNNIKYYRKSDGTWWSLGIDGKLIEDTYSRSLGIQEKKDDSAKKYVKESKEFTDWVLNNLSNLRNSNNEICSYLKIDSDNDPDKYSSKFNEHRRKVIQDSIKSNIESTLFHYNGGTDTSTFEFKMPELDEREWDRIINNVNLISFMQGIPLRNKYYMGYSVVTNTQSKEFVDPDEIYLLTGNENLQQYHKITWTGLKTEEESNIKDVAYRNIDFRRKTYMETNTYGTKEEVYYYPHGAINGIGTIITADYDSIITSTDVYVEDETYKNAIEKAMREIQDKAKRAYYTALYRERYVNYKSLNFGME